jgi:hypothetical protein
LPGISIKHELCALIIAWSHELHARPAAWPLARSFFPAKTGNE